MSQNRGSFDVLEIPRHEEFSALYSAVFEDFYQASSYICKQKTNMVNK